MLSSTAASISSDEHPVVITPSYCHVPAPSGWVRGAAVKCSTNIQEPLPDRMPSGAATKLRIYVYHARVQVHAIHVHSRTCARSWMGHYASPTYKDPASPRRVVAANAKNDGALLLHRGVARLGPWTVVQSFERATNLSIPGLDSKVESTSG